MISRKIKIENKNIKSHSVATTIQLIFCIHQRLGTGESNQGAEDAGSRLTARLFRDQIASVEMGGLCWCKFRLQRSEDVDFDLIGGEIE